MPFSPFRQDSPSARSTSQASGSKASKSKALKVKDSANSPLTFSQALTITAGMAGLVGLFSGGAVRFSLAHSPNTRALSPLQTFPSLPDSPNEASQLDLEVFEASAAPPTSLPEVTSPEVTSLERWQIPSESAWNANTDDFDTFDESNTESFTDSSATVEPFLAEVSPSRDVLDSGDLTNNRAPTPTTFDAFASRDTQGRTTDVNPLEALSNGPLLRQPTIEDAVFE